jgi:hypothetical protein
MLAFINFEGEHCRRHATAVRKHDNPLACLNISKEETEMGEVNLV